MSPTDPASGPVVAGRGGATAGDGTHERWVVRRHGDPADVLEFGPGPLPGVPDGAALVAVRASAVNFADALACQGTYQETPALPYTPGLEVCGHVVAGTPPPGHTPGALVVGPALAPAGGWAGYALGVADQLRVVPAGVDAVAAAAVQVTYPTAWVTLHHRAGLRAGEVVVVQAAAGGTGSAMVQVAAAAGATVLAIAGGPEKAAAAVRCGATEVFDHRELGDDDLVAAVRERTAGRGADVVVDPVGAPTLATSARLCGFEGRLCVVGFAGGGTAQLAANHLLVRNQTAIGVAWPAYLRTRPDVAAQAIDAVHGLLASGAVAPLVAGVVPLSGAAAALDALLAGTTVGKWVVAPDPQVDPQVDATNP